MCVYNISIYGVWANNVLCWHLYIYIVKRRRPRFVGGAIEISLIDWLIDWLKTNQSRRLSV